MNAITSIIPQATYDVRTYLGNWAYITVPMDLNGVTVIQYSPFSAFDGHGRAACNRVAEVKIWEELNPNPAIAMAWHPRQSQQLDKRQDVDGDDDDDACKWPPESSKALFSSNSGGQKLICFKAKFLSLP